MQRQKLQRVPNGFPEQPVFEQADIILYAYKMHRPDNVPFLEGEK
jgi:hypothetical protein